jgi:peroxiredoxin
MKKIIVLLFLYFFGYSQKQMPNIELQSIAGKTYNLNSDFSDNDKLYIFSFWATWCAPCINELEAIHKKYPSWKEKLDCEIVAISIDDSKTLKRVKPFLNGKGWTYDVLLDSNQELKRALSIVNVPYTIVVKNNKIVYVSNGYSQGSEEELFNKLLTL